MPADLPNNTLPPQLERAVCRNVVVGCLWSLYQRGTIDFQTFLVESVVALEQQCDVFYKQLLSPPAIFYSFPDDEAIDRDELRKAFEDMKRMGRYSSIPPKQE